jgi:hypothetical protein
MTSSMRGFELRFVLGLNLAFAIAGCGSDAGGAKDGLDASQSHGDGDGDSDDDTDEKGGDGDAAGDAGSDPEDAAADAAEEPLPVPDWDAALEQAGPPAGFAYAETKGSFALTQPEALATAFSVLAADTQDVRLFANDIQSEDGKLGVDYGAVFLESAGARFQYPKTVGHFRIAPSKDASNTFVSEPFDYRLKAWVPSPTDPQVGYLLELSSRQAVWAATFNTDFSAITKGSLRAAVLRSEAETAPFEVDAIGCFAVCKNDGACIPSGLSVLSELLDCNDAQPNVDTDGNGTKDAYRLSIDFTSERITFQ